MLVDEIIEMEYPPKNKDSIRQTNFKKTILRRKVSYQDEQTRYFEFLINNFDIAAEEVAFLYKSQWRIDKNHYRDIW